MFAYIQIGRDVDTFLNINASVGVDMDIDINGDLNRFKCR